MQRNKFTPEQRDAWRVEQKRKPTWRSLYGWFGLPVLGEHGRAIGYKKTWSHQPGAILTSAPKGTSQEGACYIVWEDRTLCKIKRNVYELLATMPPDSRVAALKKTLSGGESQHGAQVLDPVAAPVTRSDSQGMAPPPAQNNFPAPVLAEPSCDGPQIREGGEARESTIPTQPNLERPAGNQDSCGGGDFMGASGGLASPFDSETRPGSL